MTNSAAQDRLQALLDQSKDGDRIVLPPPLEQQGPVVVKRRVTIDGGGKAAIWSRQSPVISIHSANSSLHNLRVEYTGDDPNAYAIHLIADQVELKNVVVRGNILGIRCESGVWRYPHQIYLGKLEPEQDIEFIIRLVTPVACQLRSEIDGLTLMPTNINAGCHDVHMRVDGLRRDTLLYGVIAIETKGLRREIVVNAHAVPPGGPPVKMFPPRQIIWEPADWDTLSNPAPKPLPERPVPTPVSTPPVAPESVSSAPMAPAASQPQALPQVANSPLPATNSPAPAAQTTPTAVPPPPASDPLPPRVSRLRTGTSQLGSIFTSPPSAPAPPPAAASESSPAGPPPPVDPPPDSLVPPPPPALEVRKKKSAGISSLFTNNPSSSEEPPAP